MIQLFSGRALPRVAREAAGGFGKPLRGPSDGSQGGNCPAVCLEGLRPQDKVPQDGRHCQVHGEHLLQAALPAGARGG